MIKKLAVEMYHLPVVNKSREQYAFRYASFTMSLLLDFSNITAIYEICVATIFKRCVATLCEKCVATIHKRCVAIICERCKYAKSILFSLAKLLM